MFSLIEGHQWVSKAISDNWHFYDSLLICFSCGIFLMITNWSANIFIWYDIVDNPCYCWDTHQFMSLHKFSSWVFWTMMMQLSSCRLDRSNCWWSWNSQRLAARSFADWNYCRKHGYTGNPILCTPLCSRCTFLKFSKFVNNFS